MHYCLGANLARLELRVLFEELLARFAVCGWSSPSSGRVATGTRGSGIWWSNYGRETRRIRGGHGDRHRVDRGRGPRIQSHQPIVEQDRERQAHGERGGRAAGDHAELAQTPRATQTAAPPQVTTPAAVPTPAPTPKKNPLDIDIK